MTVWDAIRALRSHRLSLKHKGRSIREDEGAWIVGRSYGRLFAITASFPSLSALGDWIKAL